MPQIKTFCRIKPTEEYYPEFELSTAVLHLRVPELLRDIGSQNRNQRNIVSHEFNFDYIFNSDASQEQVFDVAAKEIVEGFLNGYNGTIFAYGQTGTGKTFTVEGSPKQYKHRGLEPRALSMIYKALEQRPDEDISVHLSYLEIYKEVGYDLLNPGARTTSLVTPFPKVSVLEGQQGIWVVRNLSVHYAASEDVAQNLLIQGQANRRVAATTVHDRSSRSHAVFTIQLSSKKPGSDIIVKSKLHLVDLAGSERVSKTGAEGHLLNEAKCINLSLHYLETVIVSLQASVSQSTRPRQHSAGHYRGYSSSLKQRPSSADGHRNIKYVPYRNSLLTMVLRDSLGGNCLTAMIATISLEPDNLGESISTCRFAGRVACIANSVSRNEEVDEKSLIRKLRRRVAELESELHCLRYGKENIDAMNAKMTDEDKLYCSEVMHKYVDGEIKDPLTEGITSPYKFRESLRVLKKMVLEGYFNKNDNDANVLELEPKNYSKTPERPTFKSERRSDHRSPERRKQRNNPTGLTTSGDDNTSEINVQMDRKQQEKTVEFPINAWEPAEPEVKLPPKPRKTYKPKVDENKLQDEPISKPVVLEDRNGNNDDKKKDTLSHLLKKTAPNKFNKTPFEQKRIKEIKKLNVKVEQLQKEQKEKEGEMMEMKIALAEEELDMMEQHVKTKLNVTKDQVEDQHAYIQQLKTTEADTKLIEQEKLVEKQLLKRQLKFQKKLDNIDDRKQQLRQQSATVKSEIQDKATLQDQFGKFRKKDGSLNTRQVFQMLKSEEKKHEKMQGQIDQEKLFLVNKHLELRETATRQKLQEFKEMLRLSKTAGLPYDTYNGEAFPNNDRAMFLKSAPAHYDYKDGQIKNNTDHDDRFSSAHTRYTQSTRLTTSDSNHDNASVHTRLPTSHSDRLHTSQTDRDNMSTVTKSTRLQTSHSNRQSQSEDFYDEADNVNDFYESRQSTSVSNRPSSAKSNRSVGSIIPDPEFYAKKKEEKDPTVKWEAGFSRNNTSSSNRQMDKNLELATDDAKSTALKSSAGVRRVEFTVESDPEPDPEPVETLMPSEYVYGMRSGDQFDARKMGLGSKSFDSALSSMLEKENVNYYVSDKDYDRYARTSKPSTRSTNRSKSRERSKSRDRSIERTYVPITVYNGWDFKESSGSRDRQRSLERVKERPREQERKTYRKDPPYSQERGRSKERKPPPQRYRNWGPEAKHYAVSDRLTTLDVKTPETKSRKSNRYDFQSKDDSNINDYLNKKPGHDLNTSLQIEETRSPRVTAIPEEEAEKTFMSKVKEQKNRVDKIRKARAAATVIQRAWRRYHARTKHRRR